MLQRSICVCRVHNMLLKGAYCVGEHFVDPHSRLSSDSKERTNKMNRNDMHAVEHLQNFAIKVRASLS